jgi:transposase
LGLLGDGMRRLMDRNPRSLARNRASIGATSLVGSGDLAVPDNITLLPLPPKCPELNVMENVWQFMRDNWLSNRVFKNYDDVVMHCCNHWRSLVEQPWRIISIGLRDWAHEF